MMKIILTLAISLAALAVGFEARQFEFHNNCPFTVWPGTQNNHGKPWLSTTGFELKQNERRHIDVPQSWGGRVWARSGCNWENGQLRCQTGDCGNELECKGRGGATPATLAEFQLDGHEGLDFYDVSLVDGFNLPVAVETRGGHGASCQSTECRANVNDVCPPELTVWGPHGSKVGCKSACVQFGKPEFCCSGPNNRPETCQPSSYAKIFSNACPRAYSYAYDDKRGTFTCKGSNYLITFCP